MRRIVNGFVFLLLGLIGGFLVSVPAYAGAKYYSAFGSYGGVSWTPSGACDIFHESKEAQSPGTWTHSFFVSAAGADTCTSGGAPYDGGTYCSSWPRDDCDASGMRYSGGYRAVVNQYDCDITGNYVRDFCSAGPPVDCPSTGTVQRLTTVINGSMDENGQFIPSPPEEGFRIEIGGGLSVDGCGYAAPITGDPGSIGYGVEADAESKCYESGMCVRFQNYVATGEAQEPADNQLETTYTPDSPQVQNIDESQGATDTTESSIVTSTTQPVTEQVGTSTLTTFTETTTESRGDGSTVEQVDDITVITQSDGITRTTTETTTTTTAEDGSQTVETTTNTAYTQYPSNIYTVDADGGVSTTTTPGGSTSQTSTSTSTFDANGNPTGTSETTGPVKGDEDTKKTQTEKTCETDPFSADCVGEFKATVKGKFADISGEATAAQTEFQAEWERIKTEASRELGFTLSGGGSLQENIVNIRGIEGDIGITRWVPYFDEFDLAALVMACAALYSVIVIFRG